MKIRLKFAKEGPVKFVGHLDTVRLFQRAIKVAKIPIAYSQGFSPHSLIYFALPLAVGMSSQGEYLDLITEKDVDPEDIKNRLNAILVEGITILEAFIAPDIKDSLMSLVKAADYKVIIPKKDFSDVTYEKIQEQFEQPTLFVEKTGKKGVKEVDIKPLVLGIQLKEEEKVFVLNLQVLAGSEANLKPELVLKAILKEYVEKKDYYFEMTREELYTYEEAYIPLARYGR